MDRERFCADYERLGLRRREVLALIGQGLSNKEIALVLKARGTNTPLRTGTIKGYVEDLLRVFEAQSRSQLASYWG